MYIHTNKHILFACRFLLYSYTKNSDNNLLLLDINFLLNLLFYITIQGAIKKTKESENVSKVYKQSRTKNRYSKDLLPEASSPSEFKDPRILQIRDSKQQNISQNSSSKLASSRINSTDKLNTPQTKSVRQNGRLSVSRSNTTTTISQKLVTKTASTGVKSDRQKTQIEKKLKNVPATEPSKSKEKLSTARLEKRGTSSIYLPKTARSSPAVASKSSSQMTGSKTSSISSRDNKEKLKKAESIEKGRKHLPRGSSRERRKSRTLSPSEVKILHSGLKTGNGPNDDRYRKGIEDIKANDETENDYDYEDDFEVLKRIV